MITHNQNMFDLFSMKSKFLMECPHEYVQLRIEVLERLDVNESKMKFCVDPPDAVKPNFYNANKNNLSSSSTS